MLPFAAVYAHFREHLVGSLSSKKWRKVAKEVGTNLAQAFGVNSFVETGCNWHTRRSIVFPSQTSSSLSDDARLVKRN
jgi:hypothetical protein